MRRDIVIGLGASFVVHGAVWFVGHTRNPPPPLAPIIRDISETFPLPPLDPQKPEPTDVKDEPAPTLEFAPPVQNELFLPTVDAPFVQPPQPPMPDGPRSEGITIPPGVRSGPRGPVEIFDPRGLDHQPDPRYQAKPVYPFEMRHAGITGQVIVGFVVDAAGNVQGAYAVSSTQREFESAAVQAVSKWKFKPGRKDGRAVSTRMQVPVVFSISEEP